MQHTGDFNDQIKAAFHYPAEQANRYERTTSCTLDAHDCLWRCVSYEEKGNRQILLQANDASGALTYNKVIRDCHMPTRPVLCARDDGGISAVWVEWSDNSWQIIYAEKTFIQADFSFTLIHSSQQACMHPALCWHKGHPFVAWSEYDVQAHTFCIFSAQYENKQWSKPCRHSNGAAHCFRPAVCSDDNSLFVAWDAGIDGKQYIEMRALHADQTPGFHDYVICRKDERLIRPSLAVIEPAVCVIACISIMDVVDRVLGISDHKTGVLLAQLCNQKLDVTPTWVAELNEGLLGKKVYVPYFGIRRKCHVTKGIAGERWLTWEMRFEEEQKNVLVQDKRGFCDEHYGYLIGKKLDRDGKWHEAVILHEGGTCYSIAGITKDNQLAIAYLQQSNVFALPVVMSQRIPCEQQSVLRTDNKHFARWDQLQNRIQKSDRYQTLLHDEKLSLYWADTHAHSNFSPDAEGEPDELILFGRDIAGLDAMAIVDNDYYPHTGLMEMEWKYQQALANAYTQPGAFVVFPGYEFTCHDQSLKPNFNHRYVIFPQEGPCCSRLDPKSRQVRSLAQIIEQTDGIMVAHHPTWALTGSPVDQFVEICSSWRLSIEEKDYIKDHLLKGKKFAFIGSSDTHRACPGLGGALTGVFAEALEPQTLLDAYKKRRTIVTQGQHIVIDFQIDDLFIGDSGSINKCPTIKMKVISPVDLDFIEIYRNDVVIRRYTPGGRSCIDSFADHELETGKYVYYVRVKTVGDPSFNETDSNPRDYSMPFIRQGNYPFNFARAHGPFAWSTPIWIEAI